MVYLSDISKKLKSGLMTEAEAQYRRKIIQDTRRFLLIISITTIKN